MPNIAGKSTRNMAQNRRRTTNYILLGILIFTIILASVLNNWQTIGISGGSVIALLILLKVLPDFMDKPLARRKKLERRAERGAISEEIIGDLLNSLGDEYLVLNDVESPFGNIDHIVIGHHSGVFLIETKAHGGRTDISDGELLINGKTPEKNFIGQVLQNTYWVREELGKIVGFKPWITPFLVFTSAFVPFGKPIKGVKVLNKKFLISSIQNQKAAEKPCELVWQARERLAERLYLFTK